MGQNTFAEWFINTMLGWIRWIGSGIAKMFQSSNSRGSSTGGQFISWFSENWVALLIALVTIGVLTDWIVWMIRWRPYWLWFRRKRVLLDDDIDAILNDEELMKKFGPPPKERAHFQASQLGRGGRPIPKDELTQVLYDPQELDAGYDEEFDAPDIEDPYDGADRYDSRVRYDEDDDDDDGYGDLDPEPAGEDEEGYEDYEKEEPFDRLYSETYSAVPMAGDDDDAEGGDEDDPDISFLEADDGEDEADRPRRRGSHRSQKPGLLSRLRQRMGQREDEDPFSVDDAEFFDPDDEADFLQRLQEAPPPHLDDDDGFAALYPEKNTPPVDDWRTGYSVYNSTVAPPAPSRRVRRQRREQEEHDN